MKKIIVIVAVITALLVFASGCQKKEGKVYQMRIGNVTAPDHILNITFMDFAERVNERSEGRIKAVVYPSGQLGSLRTMTESL
ncbi:MAG: hypothetical protein FWD91_07195, partial [Treponema sp.]|nr:hypothetical protein [Treponema sp.]